MKKNVKILLFIIGVISFFVIMIAVTSQDVRKSNSPYSSVDTTSLVDSVSTPKEVSPWQLTTYSDEFGEPTKKKVIISTLFHGTFSNSATENSELEATLLIENDHHLDIKLYEYAGSNPVKHCTEEGYKVKVRGSKDEITATGYNYSDRISLEKKDAKKIISILKKGGSVKFFLREITEYGTASSYQFNIDNSSGLIEELDKMKTK